MLSTIFAQAPQWNTLEDALGQEYKNRFGGGKALSEFFNLGLVNIVFFAAGAAFLVYLISAGLSMMTSRGDPKALEAARARLTHALVGFVIIFAAYWIVQIVGLLLGIPGLGRIFQFNQPGGGGSRN